MSKEFGLKNIEQLNENYSLKKNLSEKENNELNEINKKLKNFFEDDNLDLKSKNYIFYKDLFLKYIPKDKIIEENIIHQLLKKKLKNIFNEFIDLDIMEDYLKIAEIEQGEFNLRIYEKI